MSAPSYRQLMPPSAHAIMFHHLHGGRHSVRQGSLDVAALEALLDFLAASVDLLPAEEWLGRARRGALGAYDVCLTFDDALACQLELAAPALEARKLSAIFFVYSAALAGDPTPLEIDAHVRHTCFESMSAFYRAFFAALAASPHGAALEAALADFKPARFRPECAFYSDEDRRFRFVRDHLLSPEAYRQVMDSIVDRHIRDRSQLAAQLVMSEADVVDLRRRGHVIGLHSNRHATNITRLDTAAQHAEFALNQQHLERLLGEPVRVVAHPCGRYDQRTLDVLRDLSVDIGFRADMGSGGGSRLELPRQDQANVQRFMHRATLKPVR